MFNFFLPLELKLELGGHCAFAYTTRNFPPDAGHRHVVLMNKRKLTHKHMAHVSSHSFACKLFRAESAPNGPAVADDDDDIRCWRHILL